MRMGLCTCVITPPRIELLYFSDTSLASVILSVSAFSFIHARIFYADMIIKVCAA